MNALAFLVNLVFPGIGLILVGRRRAGVLFALLFCLAADGIVLSPILVFGPADRFVQTFAALAAGVWLWAQIRLNVGAYMHNLFRQGAFQGTSSREAYFVKCDKDTTTQTDINLGIVNILVGFAPLKPAEFVVIKIQQMAGQVET